MWTGLGVALALILWLILTIPAFLMAVGGIVAGALPRPRRTLARRLGIASWLVELSSVAIVGFAYMNLVSTGVPTESVRPGLEFWAFSAMTILAGALAIWLGLPRFRDYTVDVCISYPLEGAERSKHYFSGSRRLVETLAQWKVQERQDVMLTWGKTDPALILVVQEQIRRGGGVEYRLPGQSGSLSSRNVRT